MKIIATICQSWNEKLNDVRYLRGNNLIVVLGYAEIRNVSSVACLNLEHLSHGGHFDLAQGRRHCVVQAWGHARSRLDLECTIWLWFFD